MSDQLPFWKRNYRWVILAACCLVYSCSQIVRWNYASITSYLMSDMKIGKEELGLMGGAFFWAYGFAQIPWGSATDIFGARRVIPLGVAAVSFMMFGFATTSDYHGALFWRAAMGLTIASGFVGNTALISRWFNRKERAFALEMHSAGGGALGEVLIFVIVPGIALLLGDGGTLFGLKSWRASTAVMALFIFVSSALAFLLLKSDPSEVGLPSIQKAEDIHHDENTTYMQNIKTALKDSMLWIASMNWVVITVAARLMPGWLPLYAARYYVQIHGYSVKQAAVAAGIVVTMMAIGRLIGPPIVGKISDNLLHKKGTPRMMVVCILHVITAVMFAAFVFPMPNIYVLYAWSLLGGVLINTFPLISATCGEIWSLRMAGFNNAVLNTCGGFSGAAALSISGFVAVKFAGSSGTYAAEFQGIWYMAIINAIVGVVVSYVLSRREKANIAERQARAAAAVEEESAQA